ncbi:MAG: 3'(2'),5'-bisphosphate nucleotidase CysQ [Ilumatobacter sp.]
MNTPDSSDSQPDLHAAAVRMAELAGARLLEIRAELQAAGESGTAVKDAGDAAAQAVLAAALTSDFPADAVLSEEAADDAHRLSAERVWIIDPLDGTREFSEFDRDDWAVHVALWESGSLTAGAVALPARDITYSTKDAAPTFEPLFGRPLRLAVSRSRPPEFVTELADRLGAELVPMGSAGVKAMSVVSGQCDAYLHGGGQDEWDSAAPVAVAAAAGLFTSRLDGSDLVYNGESPWLPDLVVARPEIAEMLLAAVVGAT